MQTITRLHTTWLIVLLLSLSVARAQSLNPNWTSLLGSDPVFATNMQKFLKSETNVKLPDPTQYPGTESWVPLGDTCSAFVNIYRLSGDPKYSDQARRIADWLVASNDYLVANRDPSIPYLGWGPESRVGYFKCSTVNNFHADDLWDTTGALRCLLKVGEIDPAGANSAYFQRAKNIIDNWPYVDHSSYDGNPDTPGLLNDGPYAAAGLRWYMKSNESCENRYVKNTNIVMGEMLFRVYLLTSDPTYLYAATKVMNTQIWDILTHENLAYSSYMTYLDNSDPVYAAMARENESKIVHTDRGQPDDELMCGAEDSSCWNHLGFEGLVMSKIQQLVQGQDPALFPVPSTAQDVGTTVDAIMGAYRQSAFGNTGLFDWTWPITGFETNTYITAANCAQRFSPNAVYYSECVKALNQKNSGGTIFYSLVPDSILVQPH
jgi:hypothetical protein